MQRLFIMFPTGLPGLALVFLRASVALTLLAESLSRRPPLNGWMQAVSIAAATILFVGSWTPILSVLSLLLHAVIWFKCGLSGITAASIVTLDAVALGLLGPGAYSVDSHRFGRRVVRVSPP